VAPSKPKTRVASAPPLLSSKKPEPPVGTRHNLAPTVPHFGSPPMKENPGVDLSLKQPRNDGPRTPASRAKYYWGRRRHVGVGPEMHLIHRVPPLSPFWKRRSYARTVPCSLCRARWPSVEAGLTALPVRFYPSTGM